MHRADERRHGDGASPLTVATGPGPAQQGVEVRLSRQCTCGPVQDLDPHPPRGLVEARVMVPDGVVHHDDFRHAQARPDGTEPACRARAVTEQPEDIDRPAPRRVEGRGDDQAVLSSRASVMWTTSRPRSATRTARAAWLMPTHASARGEGALTGTHRPCASAAPGGTMLPGRHRRGRGRRWSFPGHGSSSGTPA